MPIDGTYLINVGIRFEPSSSGLRRNVHVTATNAGGTPLLTIAEIERSGTYSASWSSTINLTTEYRLLAGDYVEAVVAHDAAGALNVESNNRHTYMAVHWIGAQHRT